MIGQRSHDDQRCGAEAGDVDPDRDLAHFELFWQVVVGLLIEPGWLRRLVPRDDVIARTSSSHITGQCRATVNTFLPVSRTP